MEQIHLDRINDILTFWFGPGQSADLPTPEHTHLWFSGDPVIDITIQQKFTTDWQMAVDGELEVWRDTPRGMLALIIILDQFSRHIHRGSTKAFTQDAKALQICLQGLRDKKDQYLSLIERVFFYLPLEHSESITMQNNSLEAFETLLELSLPETRSIFQTFYEYAIEHHDAIKRFSRFPHRNTVLGRESTPEELDYLQELQRN